MQYLFKWLQIICISNSIKFLLSVFTMLYSRKQIGGNIPFKQRITTVQKCVSHPITSILKNFLRITYALIVFYFLTLFRKQSWYRENSHINVRNFPNTCFWLRTMDHSKSANMDLHGALENSLTFKKVIHLQMTHKESLYRSTKRNFRFSSHHNNLAYLKVVL